MAGWMACLLLIATGCPAQTALLGDFDFPSQGLTLLILPAGYGAPTDGSEIYFVDNVSVLQRLKTEWVFTEPALQFRSRCETDFEIHVCQGGRSLETVAIDLRCRAISSSKGRFLYDGWSPLAGTRKALKQEAHFTSLDAARKYLDSLQKAPRLIYLPMPDWANYEGEFDFYRPDVLSTTAEVTAQLEAEIRRAHPDEAFEIVVSNAGGSSDKGWNYHVRLRCNRALFDQFKLYRPTDGGWVPFPLDVVSYWRL